MPTSQFAANWLAGSNARPVDLRAGSPGRVANIFEISTVHVATLLAEPPLSRHPVSPVMMSVPPAPDFSRPGSGVGQIEQRCGIGARASFPKCGYRALAPDSPLRTIRCGSSAVAVILEYSGCIPTRVRVHNMKYSRKLGPAAAAVAPGPRRGRSSERASALLDSSSTQRSHRQRHTEEG
eukprot:COSAG01_NODE_262_length_19995_cov_33.452855_3_plen_180_part_00